MRRHDDLLERLDQNGTSAITPRREPAQFAAGTREMEKLGHADNDELVEIVHDLKNPLSTMSLELSVVDDKLTHIASSDLRASLMRLHRNVAFLDRLVQNILDANISVGHRCSENSSAISGAHTGMAAKAAASGSTSHDASWRRTAGLSACKVSRTSGHVSSSSCHSYDGVTATVARA